MPYPEFQILDSRAIIRLHAFFPGYLLAKDIRGGEADNFCMLGKRNSRWYLYRRFAQSLSSNEKAALTDYFTGNDFQTAELHDKTVTVSMSDLISDFLDRINGISGCRLSPVSLQTKGDIYLCVEFEMSQSREVSSAVLGFITSYRRLDASLVYYGKYISNIPYILRMYLEKGNSPTRLTHVETRWEFMDAGIEVENEGLFMNRGTIIPKQFSDSSSETIVMRLDSPEVKGGIHATHTYPGSRVVEILLKSGFFRDFYLNVILEYSGPIFYSSRCDGTGLTNNFIIDSAAKDSFIFGLFRNWSQERRVRHVNFITQVRNLGDMDLQQYSVAHPLGQHS